MGLEARLDQQPLRSFHWRLILLLGLGWMLIALDAALVTYMLPVLARAWSLGPEPLRWLLGAQSAGILVGALVAGWLADEFGRRPLLIGCVLLAAGATGLAALGPSISISALLMLRGVAGAGLGGAIVLVGTLMAELAPARRRGWLVVGVASFGVWGTLLAALAGLWLVPRWGWPAGFVVGALPALVVLVWRRRMPESARHLLSTGHTNAAAAVLRTLGIQPTGEELRAAATRGGQSRARRRLAALWPASGPPWPLLLGGLWCGTAYAMAGLTVWLPAALLRPGYPLTQSLGVALTTTLAQAPGFLAAAWLVDHAGRKRTLVVALVLQAITMLLLGRAGLGAGAALNETMLWGALAQCFGAAALGTLLVYTTEHYPTPARATGTGLAVAGGQLGSLAGAVVVPWLLDPAGVARLDVAGLLDTFAAVLVVAALLAALAGDETKGRPLEEIAAPPRPAPARTYRRGAS